jgi:hypothetical protein
MIFLADHSASRLGTPGSDVSSLEFASAESDLYLSLALAATKSGIDYCEIRRQFTLITVVQVLDNRSDCW